MQELLQLLTDYYINIFWFHVEIYENVNFYKYRAYIIFDLFCENIF